MTRLVKCIKLGQTLPGISHRPFKGALGERIYQCVSEEAWKQWLGRSTIVMNEMRLNPSQPEAQEVLFRELRSFLFGETPAAPPKA